MRLERELDIGKSTKWNSKAATHEREKLAHKLSRSTTIASWVLPFYCNKFLDMSPGGCNFRNILACGSKFNNGSAK
ncbi:hypothetical protein ACB092_01G163800 [Castanea dentata]